MTFNERLCARAPVYGRQGMVVAGHSAATLAGISALKRGGSIIDAMVAASAALTVTVGQATSIGGDCFLLLHEAKSGRTVGLNASGTAPQGATPERLPDGMKVHGPLAPVVPGIVRAWDVMHRRYGSLPWKSLFDERSRSPKAIRYRIRSPSDSRPRSTASRPIPAALRSTCQTDARSESATCCASRRWQRHCARLRRMAPTSSIAAPSAGGSVPFFEECGGLIRAPDLAAYEPLWVEPATCDYREHQVEVMPPNSLGVLLLMQLNGLSALDSGTLMREPGRPRRLSDERTEGGGGAEQALIADPAAVPDAVAHLTGAEMTAACWPPCARSASPRQCATPAARPVC